MLNHILRASLQNRLLVLAVAIAVAFGGGFAVHRMPVDVLPDLNRPTVTIMTEAHGMTPEDVEQLVTWPLEQVVRGAPNVVRVRSQSGVGLSVVWVEFEWSADLYRARQVVSERLQLATASFPPGVQPVLGPISSIMGQVQLIGFRSRSATLDTNSLRAWVDRAVRPRLISVPGISQLIAIGGQPLEMQVDVSADQLRLFDVTLEDVAAAVQRANVNTAGGAMSVGAKGSLVSVPGRVHLADELERAVVRAASERSVAIEDVASVRFGPSAIRTGEAGVNGGAGVILVVSKQPEVDTVALTRRLDEELERIGRERADVEIIPELFQQSAFIERAIDNVLIAIRDGAILVVIVLALFLLNFRTTLITLTAIPLSIAITALVFAAFGLGLNTMTLGGLAVAIGILVDDAIVDVENVFRRLHENAARAIPRPKLEVVFAACSEVRRPVVYGTLLVTVAYLPLFFLQGIEGRLFVPIGLAYVISVFASLIVALTVTPVLCYLLLGSKPRTERGYGGWLMRNLRKFTERCVRMSLRAPVPILGVLGALAIGGAVIMATRGSTFLPPFNEGAAQVNLLLPPDSSLAVSDEYGRRLETVLREVSGIRHVGRRTGRAAGDEHAMPVSVTEAVVSFDPDVDRSREEILEEIRERLEQEFPGVATSTEQPLAHLLSHLLSGVSAQVAIKLSGPDLSVLRRSAKEVEQAVRGVAGVRDLYVEPQVLVDQIQIIPKREELRRFGLTVEELAHTVELALGGEQVAEVFDGQLRYPVIVRLRAEDRQSVVALSDLSLRRADGRRFPLSDVAEIRTSWTPNLIQREDGSRRIVVQHNIGGRSLGEVVTDVTVALEPVRERLEELPGYSLKIRGQFEAQAAASRLILLLSVLALGAMVGVLFLHFGSLNLALQVLVSIPMAFVGAVAGVLISGQPLSVATLVGFVALGGIAARNGILLIDHYLHLMREEGEPFGVELLVRAGQERMVPVLMTALTSGMALVPLVLTPDQPGREIIFPVATVILGGLVSSTLLDFIVRPGLFWLAAGRIHQRLSVSSVGGS